MKTLFYTCTIALISLTLLFASSCKKEDGGGISPKFPELVSIEKTGGETIIEAKNDVTWWFNFLKINGELIEWSNEAITFETTEFNPENMDDKLGIPFIYKITGEWFTIEKIGNNKLKITMNENNSDETRSLNFGTQAGNAFGGIIIIQDSNKE